MYEAILNRAKELVKWIVKQSVEYPTRGYPSYSGMYRYLVGFPGFALYLPDGMGGKEFAASAIMESIYDYYKADPSILDMYVAALHDIAENNRYGVHINNMLKCLEYQLNAQKRNASPFVIDASEILEKLRKNIAEHYDRFCMETEDSPNGFIVLFKEHDQLLSNYYGYRIL